MFHLIEWETKETVVKYEDVVNKEMLENKEIQALVKFKGVEFLLNSFGKYRSMA